MFHCNIYELIWNQLIAHFSLPLHKHGKFTKIIEKTQKKNMTDTIICTILPNHGKVIGRECHLLYYVIINWMLNIYWYWQFNYCFPSTPLNLLSTNQQILCVYCDYIQVFLVAKYMSLHQILVFLHFLPSIAVLTLNRNMYVSCNFHWIIGQVETKAFVIIP